MKVIFTLVICLSIAFITKAQDCSSFHMQGYHSDTTITINEATRLILTSFAATNPCNEKLKLKSGNFFLYTLEGLIGTAESFTSTLDNETKLRLISRLKPGMKIMLENMVYGDEGKQVPNVAITLIKGF